MRILEILQISYIIIDGSFRGGVAALLRSTFYPTFIITEKTGRDNRRGSEKTGFSTGTRKKMRENKAVEAKRTQAKRRRDAFLSWCGSWCGSLTLHALGLILLIIAISRDAQDGGFGGERQTDEVGIVFRDAVEDAGGEENADPAAEATATDAPQTPEESRTEDLTAVSEALLPADSRIGVGAQNAESPALDWSGAASNGNAPPAGNVGAGRGDGQRVGFAGTSGSGRRFLYVIDRSESMSWNGGAPMRRALDEAVASVESLDPKKGATKFQVAIFNHDVEIFENADALIDVNFENKARIVRYLRSVVADGGTRPELALENALRLKPDVVFFLTDADEELSEAALESIQTARRRFNVKQICVVEFGRGSQSRKKTFRRLAGENGGVYVFRDIETF